MMHDPPRPAPRAAELACFLCLTYDDYDDEKITRHCDEHCPRVAAGDWLHCRGC